MKNVGTRSYSWYDVLHLNWLVLSGKLLYTAYAHDT